MKTRLLFITVLSSFLGMAQIYVDQTAIGLDDGSSWANAYTDLNDAANAATNGDQIWIAAGTYKPAATDRTQSFTFSANNLSIYGGFNGTETMLSQRDHRINFTILSGDLNGDDTGVDYTGVNRTDNSYHVVTVNGNNTKLYGLTITSGQADGSTNNDKEGAAIFDNGDTLLLTDMNIISNVCTRGGALRCNDILGGLVVVSSIFDNNLANFATAIYFTRGSGSAISSNVEFRNSIFSNNTLNNTTGVGSGSVAWLRNEQFAGITFTSRNCTYVKNNFVSATNSQSAVVLYSPGSQGTTSGNIFNSIFWDNKKADGTNLRSVTNGVFQSTNSGAAVNNIAADGLDFLTNQSSIISSSPQFTTGVNGDFELDLTSPAINAGDNIRVIGYTEDIYGNPRIIDTFVDMGAVEFDATTAIVYIPDVNLKAALVGNTTINTSGDSEIQASEALAYSGVITVPNLMISDPTGIESFPNITGLDISNNNITALDISTLFDITSFNASNNNLLVLNVKNGFNTNITGTDFNTTNNPLLTCIDVDDVNYSITNWTLIDAQTSFSLECERTIYVDAAATGQNTGVSWADAYTDLQIALTNNPSRDFWVKAGTYIPGSGRSSSFTLTESQKIYGGFDGTEVALSQRDLTTNQTILSGDINGDDAAVFLESDSNRTENSYRIIEINGANTVIDGLRIIGANANGSSNAQKEGPAINMLSANSSLLVNNCVLSRHTADRSGLIRSIDVTGNVSVLVNNTIFEDNHTVFATCFYGRADTQLDTKFEGCLFINNRATTTNNGSLFWFRQDNSGSQTTEIINSSLTNNTIDSGTPAIIYTGTSSTITIDMFNSIFWNNTNGSGTIINALQTGSGGSVANTISNNGFTGNSNTSNISTSDPLFMDAANGDYTLQMSSPAIDAGDNSVVNNSTDILDNQRIFNGVVDMGVYEFGSATLNVETFLASNLDIKLYPNPTSNLLHLDNNTLSIQNIEIYNVMGQKLLTTTKTEINVSSFTPGLYLLKAKTNSGTIVKRFIKQ